MPALPHVPTRKILEILAQTYPDAKCELVHRNPFELLIATILSAQCTDIKVNQVTARLFQRYPTAEAFLTLSLEQLETEIKSLGLYKNKAKNILATCRLLVEQHQGQVPRSMEELIKLPGVGRKTANVVLSNAFGIPALAVDTHVHRVANRLGLAQAKTPEETERQLRRRIPKSSWSQAHHWLIFHGRRVCSARSPQCHRCPLSAYCREGKRRKIQA